MTHASRASRTTRWWVSLVMMVMTLTLTTTRASETTSERDVLEDVVLTLERWVRAPASASTRGARVSDGVRVVATTRGAGRGVAATRNISVGELLVDVLWRSVCPWRARGMIESCGARSRGGKCRWM